MGIQANCALGEKERSIENRFNHFIYLAGQAGGRGKKRLMEYISAKACRWRERQYNKLYNL